MGYVFPLKIPRNFLEFLYSGLFGYITSKSSLTFFYSKIRASRKLYYRVHRDRVSWCSLRCGPGVFRRTPRRARFCTTAGQTSDLVKCRWIIAEVNAGGFSCFHKCLCQSIRVNIPGRAIFPDSGTDHEIGSAYQPAAIDYRSQT